MNVETYEVEEINSSEASTMAADSESIALCEKLGLSGQMKLTDKETDTRCPYRRLSALEDLVFTTMFPAHTKVEAYSSGVIPLRVLQVLSHAKELPIFKGFMVLHPVDSKTKDPVLLGHTGSYWEWDAGDKYLLARWGEALEPFEALTEKAKAIWTAARKAFLSDLSHRVQSSIANVEHDAVKAFTTGQVKAETITL